MSLAYEAKAAAALEQLGLPPVTNGSWERAGNWGAQSLTRVVPGPVLYPRLQHPETEGLRDRRLRTVEHRVRAGDLRPRCAHVRRDPRAQLDRAHIRRRLGALQPPRERHVSERIGRVHEGEGTGG